VVSKQRGRGVYILKEYKDMSAAEKAAYRKKILETPVKREPND
jgi:predicted RNA-binding protein YlxR (DUF448 family)